MKTPRASILPLLFLLCLAPLAGQEDLLPAVDPVPADTAPLSEFLGEARNAIRNEYYQKALDLLDRAGDLYPESYEVPLLRGDLYEQKELYNLALETYTEADRLNPEDYDILYRIATVLGRLNRNRDSVAVLESLSALHPDSLDVAADLGWMYFKTFRTKDGEILLLDALERFGDDPGLLMTLGTVYTGLYDYEKGVEYYQRSIDAALETGWTYFAAVAYYNLALLNQSHHHFQEALDNTRLSLDMAPRPSGFISLGEIAVSRMEFPNAQEAFTNAYHEDDTPLSLMSLAELYWRFGMLDAAESHLDQVREWKDDSWMYYFGIDPKRHRRDLHDLYGRIYRSQGFAGVRAPARGWERFKALGRGVLYRLKGWYHRRLYRSLSWEIGREFDEEGNSFDADVSSYNALEEYPRLAREALRRAREFEISVTPASEASYLLETGRLWKDSSLLLQALEGLDPVWEAQEREEALAALIPLWEKEGGPVQKGRDTLYGLNPGAFLREGLLFSVVWEGPEDRGLKSLLRRGGLELLRPDQAREARYRLVLESGTGSRRILLRDERSGAPLWEEILVPEDFPADTPTRLVLAQRILTALFTVR